MSFRAKLTVTKVEPNGVGGARVQMTALYDSANAPEDNSYAKYTPFAQVDMQIENPVVLDQIALGKRFYVDFTEVPS